MRLRRVSFVFVVVFLAGPSMTWAGPGRPVGRDAPVSTMAPVVTGPFGPASIARAVAAEVAAQTQGDAQAPAQAPTQKKSDRVWNGVLIGAGVGAAVGAISAASGDDCLGYTDPGGAFVCVMRQDPDVGINVAFGALVGAGVGALVDLLIK